MSLPGAASAATASFSNDDGITIYHNGHCTGSVQGQAAPYPSTIAVSGLAGQVVTDVNVSLSDWAFGNPANVRVLLVGPEGETVLLLHENGSNWSFGDLDVGFDDAASSPPPTDDSALGSGPYKPSNQSEGFGGCIDVSAADSFPAPAPEAGGGYGSALSGFDGTDPNGDWDLYVVDAMGFAGGVILGWRLEITTAPAPNAAPAAVHDAYTHTGSDTPLWVPAADGVLANDTDPDGDSLTAVKVTNPSNGTVTAFGSNGSFTYQPNENFVGTDSFTYKANDGEDDSNVATVTITVRAGCNGLQATITGTGGANKLTGTGGADVIAGLGGNDTILGAGGNDTVCGGSGNDSLNAGAGNDNADGGSGTDTVRGDVGDDTLLGGAGADSLLGDAGNDTLSGGAGSPDSCKGDAGTDALVASHGCEQTSGVP